MEEEGSYDKGIQPEDVVPDEYAHYGSEDENIEQKPKEKPLGPPLELDVPLIPPPGRTDRVSLASASNAIHPNKMRNVQ
jgi:RNA polymerase-associated protein LEO1